MTDIGSEEDLVHCFREIDRPDVEPPEKVRYPLALEDVYAWTSGPRAFLVFRDRPDARPKGIVFHRGTGSQPDVAAMCEWCHAVRGHGGVKLLSASTDDHHTVGLYLCSDLSCLAKVGEIPGTDDLFERVDPAVRAKKILERIASFAARRIF